MSLSLTFLKYSVLYVSKATTDFPLFNTSSLKCTGSHICTVPQMSYDIRKFEIVHACIWRPKRCLYIYKMYHMYMYLLAWTIPVNDALLLKLTILGQILCSLFSVMDVLNKLINKWNYLNILVPANNWYWTDNNIEMLTPVPLHDSILLQFIHCFYWFLTKKKGTFKGNYPSFLCGSGHFMSGI